MLFKILILGFAGYLAVMLLMFVSEVLSGRSSYRGAKARWRKRVQRDGLIFAGLAALVIAVMTISGYVNN